MKKGIALLAALLAAAVAGTLARQGTKSVLQREDNVRSAEFLLKVASKINENMPMMVDSETEMMNVSAAEATIIYNYRLMNVSADEVSASQLHDNLKPTIVTAACSTPQTRDDFLKQGVTMRYVYYDKIKTNITSFDVTPTDCGFD